MKPKDFEEIKKDDLDLYLKCFFFASKLNQTVGKEKYFFVTIEQMELLADGLIPEKYEP